MSRYQLVYWQTDRQNHITKTICSHFFKEGHKNKLNKTCRMWAHCILNLCKNEDYLINYFKPDNAIFIIETHILHDDVVRVDSGDHGSLCAVQGCSVWQVIEDGTEQPRLHFHLGPVWTHKKKIHLKNYFWCSYTVKTGLNI